MYKTNNSYNDAKKTPITIMLGADSNYFYPALVLLVSLFHNHRTIPVKVYFLYSDIKEKELLKFKVLTNKFSNKEIICIKVNNTMGLKSFGRFSVAAFYRILGMKLLPDDIHKILYLDTDMIVNKDLSPLFTLPVAPPYMHVMI